MVTPLTRNPHAIGVWGLSLPINLLLTSIPTRVEWGV
jgi:hypothetical protein